MGIINVINEYGNQLANKAVHIYKDSQLSYSELVQQSDALATYIIDELGQDKSPIVVCGHKQHEMLTSFLACVKAGHPYIPVDSSLPVERVNDIIISSKSKMILSIGEFAFDVDHVIFKSYEQIKLTIKEYEGHKPDPAYQVKDDETYYIIYTSGSTGKPKGVQISLNNLESFIRWGLKLIQNDEKQNMVFMNQAPFSFDLSVMDLYLSLASGSTLCSIDKHMIENPKQLFESFRESGISIWVSTPSFAEMCLADSHFHQELLPNLELFMFCGEILSNATVDALNTRFENPRILNTYGPTEATVAVTSIEVTTAVNKTYQPLPVGMVKDDCEVIIMSPKGEKVADGEKGEIVILGESVSKGYYKNTEMTERFFSKVEREGVLKNCYHTGDEGYLENGLLFYSGRIDFQVKLNGYRIELEDIENNIRKIDFVKNCVVLPVKKENKIQSLLAVVTLKQTINEKEFKIALQIKNELKKLLPEYMIPRKIAIRESLPMTINGKIDRKRLMEEIG